MADLDVTQDANLTTITAPVAADRLLLTRNSDSVLGDITFGTLQSLLLNPYKFSITVAANDLIVALKHPDGTDPSTDKALYFNIGGTIRSVTAATSFTIPDGTSYFGSGSAQFGTKLVGYFVYAVWDSNSTVVALSCARVPWGRLVSDFSNTTTNEKHLFNYANFTSTDDVANIGYFEATLSLVATSHLWTVPAFTNANNIPQPTYETQYLTYVPTLTGFSGSPTTDVAQYQICGRHCRGQIDNITGTSNATNFAVGAPMANNASSTYQGSSGFFTDNGAALTASGRVAMAAGGTTFSLLSNMANGTWTGSGTKGAYFLFDYRLA